MSAATKSTALSFEVERDRLGAELSLAALAASCEGRPPIPALVSMSVDAGRVDLSVAGLDVLLRSSLEAKTTGTGSFALDARKLDEIVRRLPDGPVRLSVGTGRRVVLSSAGATFRLLTRDPFTPARTQGKSRTEATCPAEVLRTALTRTAYAMTEAESRYTLACVRIEIGCGRLRAVATDGRRLAMFEHPVDAAGDRPIAFLAPRAAVAVLRRLAAQSTGSLAFSSDGEWTSVRCADRELTIRSMAGAFPAYEQIVPATTEYSLTVGREAFAAAIHRASLIADPGAPAVRLVSGDGALVVGAERTDTGEMTDSVPAVGDAIDVLASGRYLADFLSRVGGESIRIGFGSSRSAIVMTPVSEPFRTIAVLMPMA